MGYLEVEYLKIGDVTFSGYRRRDRKSVGVRNHILIVPTVFCANTVARRIEDHFKDCTFGEYKENRVIAINHGSGCCHIGFDEYLSRYALESVAMHPNVGGCLIVHLGCGQFCINPKKEKDYDMGEVIRRRSMKNVRNVNIHEYNAEEAVKKGIEEVEYLLGNVSSEKREKCTLNGMILSVLNGASDPTSGLFANPCAGYISDFIIHHGGSVVFSQTPELIGAEEIAINKCAPKKRSKLRKMIETTLTIESALREKGALRVSNPTQGNIQSGISTLAEKSIGTILKIGHDNDIKIRDVLTTYKRISVYNGLYFMEGPGQDLLNMTGMVVGGSQCALFTTGMGTPLGSVIVPVVKMTANKETYEKMKDSIDIYIPIERIFKGEESLKDISIESILPDLLKMLSGKILTKSEISGQRDFQIRNTWMII